MEVFLYTDRPATIRAIYADLYAKGINPILCPTVSYLFSQITCAGDEVVILGHAEALTTAIAIRTQCQNKPAAPKIICLGVRAPDDRRRRIWFLPPDYQSYQVAALVQRITKNGAR